MKVMRFMGVEEAFNFINGIELVNKKDHKKDGANTTSVGFCFANGDDTLYTHAKHLIGIVSEDVAFVGTLKPGVTFTKSSGVYSKHGPLPKNSIEALNGIITDMLAMGKEEGRETLDEWCTKKYSVNDFTEWKMYTGKKPLVSDMKKLGMNKFQQDLASEIGSGKWIAPILVSQGGTNE